MTTKVAKQNTNVAQEINKDYEEYLRHLAEKDNVPGPNFVRFPWLKINQGNDIDGVPAGVWLYGTERNDDGEVVDPGIQLQDPQLLVLTVRCVYIYEDKEKDKMVWSPKFKSFNQAEAKQYKVNTLGKGVTADDLKGCLIAFAYVNIENTWKQCVIRFHGTNFMIFSKYIRNFEFPYYSCVTTLKGLSKEKNGAVVYYKISEIEKGKLLPREKVEELSRIAEKLKDELEDEYLQAESGNMHVIDQNNEDIPGEEYPQHHATQNGNIPF